MYRIYINNDIYIYTHCRQVTFIGHIYILISLFIDSPLARNIGIDGDGDRVS